MNGSTPLYSQLLGFFSQYSQAKDWRHLKTLSWMVSALIGSGKLSLPEWEPYVVSIATQSQSYERRWLRATNWHYALRLKCDALLHGIKRYPVPVGQLYPLVNQAQLLT